MLQNIPNTLMKDNFIAEKFQQMGINIIITNLSSDGQFDIFQVCH